MKIPDEYRKVLHIAFDQSLQGAALVVFVWVLSEIGLALGMIPTPPGYSISDRLGILGIIAIVVLGLFALATVHIAVLFLYRTMRKVFWSKRSK